jgi:predicted ribosomally synthesized peptide with SipW-like signal peptide
MYGNPRIKMDSMSGTEWQGRLLCCTHNDPSISIEPPKEIVNKEGPEVKKRTWIILALIVVLMVVGIIVVPTMAKFTDTETSTNNVVQSNWYNFSWLYREPITINNTGSALTNYQIQLTLNLSTPISSSHMLASGNDIRFTSSDGQTLLNYWIESISTPAAAVIWVKLPSIPVGSPAVTIYMYYGNSGATVGSNGDNTFIFFDDFETYPFTKWTGSTTPNTGTMTQISSSPTPDHGSYCAKITRTGGTFTETATFTSSPTVAIVEYSAAAAQTNQTWQMQVLSSTSAVGPSLEFTTAAHLRYNNNLQFSTDYVYTATTWYHFKEDNVNATTGNYNYYLYINGSTVRPAATAYTPFSTNIGNINKIMFSCNANSSMYVDFLKVRVYAATVPTLGTQGAEQ